MLADRPGGGINRCLPLSPIGLRLKETFLVTGSQDCTVKLWPLPEAQLSKSTAPDSGPALLQAQATQRCHDKVTTYGTLGWECGRALTGTGGLSSCHLLLSPGHQQCGHCPQ